MTQHTPGPWAWYGNARTNSIYLATEHSGRRLVMAFRRWGMNSAQPVFQPDSRRGMVAAAALLKFEVGDKSVTGYVAAKADHSVYRYDVCGIDCADARLIAAAPDLLEAAKHLVAFINDEGPAAMEWRAISDWTEKLDAAIAKAEGRS